MIAFKGQKAEILLNITGSLELAEKCLRFLPTGGKTPLADGLFKAEMLLRAERIRSPNVIQYMVLVTDGKANVPLKSENAFNDAAELADDIYRSGVSSMVLDTENGYIQFGFAKKLAESMSSQYIKLNDINKNDITDGIRNLKAINE
jgi:magnesium chelatase subunit D